MKTPTCSRDFVGAGRDEALKRFPGLSVEGAEYLASDERGSCIVDWYLLGSDIYYVAASRGGYPNKSKYMSAIAAARSPTWGPVIKAALAERGL